MGYVAPCVLIFALTACGGKGTKNPLDDGGTDGGTDGGGGLGSVQGHLASSQGLAFRSLAGLQKDGLGDPGFGGTLRDLSIDEVSVDLLRAIPGENPDTWPLEATATPDASGGFAFEGLAEGSYALRVRQPEFAALAYGVDTTEFHLGAGQTVRLVLPLISTVAHGLTDSVNNARTAPPFFGPWRPATALDPDTGEIALTTGLGFALVDPDRGQVDLLFSRHLFHGRPVVALAPDSPTAWLLYPDRLIRVDRSLFTDPETSEVFDLDDAATLASLGDGIRIGIWAPPEGFLPDYFIGDSYFSPDERFLFATTKNAGALVVDLEEMEIVRVILGHIAGYNRVANHLFFANGIGLEGGGTEVLVVDATTRLEVAVVPLANPLGVAAVPGSDETILVGAQLSTSNVMVPFIKVVDGTGAVIADERARDYLGLAEDPEPGAPSFDQSGDYFMIGSAAFRVLPGGDFEPVPRGIEAGDSFGQRMQGNGKRAVDPVNLFELWYGSEMLGTSVGLFSLAGTNLPVAVRPSVPTTALLLDQARGRAIFWGVNELVLIHYADPSAAGRDEWLDRSDVTAPFVAEGAVCSSSAPCPGTEFCAGATDTAFTGRCTPNPRLPYLPYCGGFGQLECDEGYTCEKTNPTNPNSIGYCWGYPYRDYAVHGPVCGQGLPCPAGMLCDAGGRCEPKHCLFDADCGAYPGEICGQLDNIGRVCLAPGPLPDGAPCTGPGDCAHGLCAFVRGAWASGEGDLLYGTYGLGICTRPCFQNSDCSPGDPCLTEWTHFGDNYLGDSVGMGRVVWNNHRGQVMPFCWPAAQVPVPQDCDGACLASNEICGVAQSPRCTVGFGFMIVGRTPGGNVDYTCLPPTQAINPSNIGEGCALPCLRSGDCPFEGYDCAYGLCLSGSHYKNPCDGACAPDEICAITFHSYFWDVVEGLCVAANACVDDQDCVSPAICKGVCTTLCSINADCAEGECVAGLSGYTNERYCLPAQCGCTGALVGDTFCNAETWVCTLPGLCNEVPCDGSVDPQCTPAEPSPPLMDCACPSCAWNQPSCPGAEGSQVCPSGFVCTGLGDFDLALPPTVGSACLCNDTQCQSP